MKRNILHALSALASAFLMAGCNEIPADDRYIEVEAVKVERTVLLEDFTGQGCVNCPAAHKIIEALEEQYGRNFIAVSIHAGPFGVPADNKRYTGLMQEEGQIYNDRYGIIDYPQGVLDGKLPALNSDQWAGAVYDEISAKTPVSIAVEAKVTDDMELIDVTCTVQSSESVEGDFVLWMVESDIVARQEDINEGRIPDYVHNNVFRACINGLDGVTMTAAPTDDFTCSYTIPVKNTDTEKWNVDNLAVVAFVKTSAGIVQAASTQVIK
ncbi:MAG: Omp28 family outer membrane lipoprotein [Duncaniella sp.]|nr:Omp28 family outer membrane lipoprotein [Duncaniella sp.]